IRDLFLEHRMKRTFCLILLHRQFGLDKDERVVEYQGTSVPWTVRDIGKNVVSSCWIICSDGTVRPYEFQYTGPATSVEGEDPDPSRPDQHSSSAPFAEGLFGLCRYPGDNFKGRVEMTEGRVNINLIPRDCERDTLARTVAWFFSPLLWEFRCVCK
ncbi:hypothetical protein K469DRAFT_537295, partial [Zopfia rhizophila CBS 207.26]